MLTEYDIYLYAASCGWAASLELVHADDYVMGVFLTRGEKITLLGPLGAVICMTGEQFFDSLERLEGAQTKADEQA